MAQLPLLLQSVLVLRGPLQVESAILVPICYDEVTDAKVLGQSPPARHDDLCILEYEYEVATLEFTSIEKLCILELVRLDCLADDFTLFLSGCHDCSFL